MARLKEWGIALVQYVVIYLILSFCVVGPLLIVLDASPEGRTGLTLLALIAALPITRLVRRRWRRREPV